MIIQAKKRYTLVLYSALAIYFVLLVVSRAPASLAASLLHAAAPNVWLMEVTGTIWKGKAQAAQVDVDGRPISLGRTDWQLHGMSLLMFKPCITFKAVQSQQIISGKACQSLLGTTHVKDVSVEAPAEVVSVLVGTPLNGRVSATVKEAKLSSGKVDLLKGNGAWQNARVQVEGAWYSFGSYAADFKETGNGGVSAQLFDLDGPYGVNMKGDWTPESGWLVKGNVTPEPSANPQVVQVLQIIGEETEENSGTYALAWP